VDILQTYCVALLVDLIVVNKATERGNLSRIIQDASAVAAHSPALVLDVAGLV
jgi:hypothetical protein